MRKLSVTTFSFFSSQVTETIVFAFLSDLHNYTNQALFDCLQRINPDAILVAGDFIQSKTDTTVGLEFLQYCSSKWPVFCSSGKEHEFDDQLIKQIENTGVKFLRNRVEYFKNIIIGGLNTLPLLGKTINEQEYLIEHNRRWLKEISMLSGYKILLCHHPEYYDMFIKDYNIDLILAGHAHGGQIRLFNRGLWAPGQGWFPRYTSGLYDGKLLVGRGIGNTHRIPRINNNPEIIEIRLNK